jgi:hypothetical protein
MACVHIDYVPGGRGVTRFPGAVLRAEPSVGGASRADWLRVDESMAAIEASCPTADTALDLTDARSLERSVQGSPRHPRGAGRVVGKNRSLMRPQ